MKQVRGVWLPDGEEHLVPILEKAVLTDGTPEYQGSKLVRSLSWVKNWRGAVDVGANVGLWTIPLARRFAFVQAIEPVAEHRACWVRNVNAANTRLYAFAVGHRSGRVRMEVEPSNSSGATVHDGDETDMRCLDDVELIEPIDYLKIDCNGYELMVLKGAVRMLERWKPCVCVEQKPGRAQRLGLPEIGAVTFLQSLGAVLRDCMNGVYVLSWEG